MTIRGVRRTAHVSCRAVVANACLLASADALGSVVADVRANAYGYGLLQIGSALADANVGALLVSRDSDRKFLEHSDIAVPVFVQRIPKDYSEHTFLGPEIYASSSASGAQLHATMRVSTEVLSIKRVPEGQGVSYGYTYRTSSPANLVLAGLGYADGIPRCASNRAPVLVTDTRSTISGRIAMDQFVVDIGDGVVDIGDDIVLFGDGHRGEPTLGDWSHATGMRPWVITAALGERVERVYDQW